MASLPSTAPGAAAPETGSSSTSPVPSNPLQPVKRIAMEMEDCCPICLGNWEEVSYVMPCHHQFCYQCILQWAETKPECPLCKRGIQVCAINLHKWCPTWGTSMDYRAAVES
uniref:RING-type E3 ubiquitin transferase n=1 Tax=Melopsittacus undulatus TaxID=13146 RepID=A0A8C6JWM6_MELUD